MASIFPAGGNGGVTVRDANGNPIPVSNVPNAYLPVATFSTSCDLNYLRDDCFSRISPGQINAITSELICLAEYMFPTMSWNCDNLCNLSSAFQHWVEDFTSRGISEDLCGIPTAAGAEPDASLIYCGNGQALKLRLYGENSLIQIMTEHFCSATPSLVPPADANFFFCDPETGDIRSTPLALLQLYRGPWVEAEGYDVTNMVQRNGALWSPNAVIPPGTPFIIGTSGTTWREVSGNGFSPLDANVAYPKDSVILHNGRFWASNDLIPAGTPFEIGTTGETWRNVDLTKAPIFDYNPARAYEKDSVVVVDGIMYRAPAGVAPTVAFNPANWQQIGGDRNVYRGSWQQVLGYRADDMVLVDDKLYVANAEIPPGAIFVIGDSGATWREVSKTELAGQEIDTEMVVFLHGGWLQDETILAYKCAKTTTFPLALAGSRGDALESVDPINTSASIFINGVNVGAVDIVGQAIAFTFPAAHVMQPNDVLRIVANADQAFEYVTLNFFVQQMLL